LEKLGINRAIIIMDTEVTGYAKTSLLAVSAKVRYETFTTSELLIDITEHELVPEHQVLTDEEKKQILKRYNLKDSQLPRMMLDDPISRYFGLSRGQVVKIIRASETAGRYVTYRIVI
jgi:DNA-directed RNA polymerase I, II, and III subunit RPABC1